MGTIHRISVIGYVAASIGSALTSPAAGPSLPSGPAVFRSEALAPRSVGGFKQPSQTAKVVTLLLPKQSRLTERVAKSRLGEYWTRGPQTHGFDHLEFRGLNSAVSFSFDWDPRGQWEAEIWAPSDHGYMPISIAFQKGDGQVWWNRRAGVRLKLGADFLLGLKWVNPEWRVLITPLAAKRLDLIGFPREGQAIEPYRYAFLTVAENKKRRSVAPPHVTPVLPLPTEWVDIPLAVAQGFATWDAIGQDTWIHDQLGQLPRAIREGLYAIREEFNNQEFQQIISFIRMTGDPLLWEMTEIPLNICDFETRSELTAVYHHVSRTLMGRVRSFAVLEAVRNAAAVILKALTPQNALEKADWVFFDGLMTSLFQSFDSAIEALAGQQGLGTPVFTTPSRSPTVSNKVVVITRAV